MRNIYDEAPVAVVPEREAFIEPAPLAAVPVAAAASPHRETVSTPMGDVVEPDEFAPATGEAIAVPEEAVVAKGDQADAEALCRRVGRRPPAGPGSNS